MQFNIKISNLKTIDELEGSWTNEDLIALLKVFGYAEAEQVNASELREYLFMAIADYEPNEAAALLLEYRLSEELEEGQIHNISHEMEREKVAENYSDITMHKALFEVNQLLYKAYNGTFPLTKATVITFEMQDSENTEITKDLIIQALSKGLSPSNLIHRLFDEQLEGKIAFPEAEGIVWELQEKGNSQYVLTTSEKWIGKEDFMEMVFDAEVLPFEEETEED
ncbi:MAG: hypothetical protein H0X63_02470 [Flavobacteriales bacterium]|nr:hypothetical protein [Flavobacteriales bacterium]